MPAGCRLRVNLEARHPSSSRMANIGGISCFGLLLILSTLGYSFQVEGSLIHVLLVVALVVVILQLVTGRSCPEAQNALHRCEVNFQLLEFIPER
jgi:hypothetical protein